MQELRSTEILDKEIHSDAVKKAEKILKKADADCEALLASVDTNIQKDLAEKQDFFNEKLNACRKDEEASIPLEKQRFEVTFVQNQIVKGINEYLAALTEDKRIEIVTKGFDFNIDRKVNAFVYGFSTSAVKKILSKKLGSNLLKCEETKFGKIVQEDDYGLEKLEGIILESENRDYRVHLTMSQVIGHLLDVNRAELSDALFGGQK